MRRSKLRQTRLSLGPAALGECELAPKTLVSGTQRIGDGSVVELALLKGDSPF